MLEKRNDIVYVPQNTKVANSRGDAGFIDDLVDAAQFKMKKVDKGNMNGKSKDSKAYSSI